VNEAYAVAKYSSTCYYVCHAGVEEDNEEYFCEYTWDEEVAFSGKLNPRNRFLDYNLRRTIVDFGRCFLSGTIAGGSFRNTVSVKR